MKAARMIKAGVLALSMVCAGAMASAQDKEVEGGTWVLTSTEYFCPKGTLYKQSWITVVADLKTKNDDTVISHVVIVDDANKSSCESYHECTPPKSSYKAGEEVNVTLYAYEKNVVIGKKGAETHGWVGNIGIFRENKNADDIKYRRWGSSSYRYSDFYEKGTKNGVRSQSKENRKIYAVANMPIKARYGDRIAIFFENSTSRGDSDSAYNRNTPWGGSTVYYWIYTYQAPGSSASASWDLCVEPGFTLKLPSGTWTSSDTSVIKVYKNGKALTLGAGTATLISSSGKKLVIKVEEE